MKNSKIKNKNFQKELEDHQQNESTSITRSNIRDFILGYQDGLVNTLGLVLGVASAVQSSRLVLISGLVTTFAESVSMAAVAYTSNKAAHEFYSRQLEKEKREIEEIPHIEREEIKQIFYKKGFRGKQLDGIVKKITSDKQLWLDTMMSEELRLYPDDYDSPVKSGFVVGLSAVIGSLVPVLPFFFFSVKIGMIASLVLSILTLFTVGAVKSKMTVGSWKKSGLEMMLVGTVAALVGYVVGSLLGVIYP